MIFSYTVITTAGPNGTRLDIQLPNNPSQTDLGIVRLGELDGKQYVYVPAGIELPAEQKVEVTPVVDTSALPKEWQAHLTDDDLKLMLSKAKNLKLQELSAVAEKFQQSNCENMYFTSSLGYPVDGDRKAGQDIAGLIRTFETISKKGVTTFVDRNNTPQKVTLEQLNTLLKEQTINGQNLYQQKWVYRGLINAAKSIADLNALTIEFTMMDFTQE